MLNSYTILAFLKKTDYFGRRQHPADPVASRSDVFQLQKKVGNAHPEAFGSSPFRIWNLKEYYLLLRLNKYIQPNRPKQYLY